MRCDVLRKQSLIRTAALLVLAGLGQQARGQFEAPTDFLQITTDTAQTWDAGETQVIAIPTPVTIKTDRATFTADSAVVWFSRAEQSVLRRQRAEIALIGNAKIVQGPISRSGERLFGSTVVGGPVRLTVENRQIVDPRDSDLFKIAEQMRPITARQAKAENLLIQRPWVEPQQRDDATQRPIPTVTPKAPVVFSAEDVQTSTDTPDGNIAIVLKGDVLLMQRRATGDLIELQAAQAVLFTTVKDFNQLQGAGIRSLQDAVTAAYLEGDVRINYTPAAQSRGLNTEQRLEAQRVYYEFATDKAVLTEVVLQAKDPRVPFPLTLRAGKVRQLSLGEYQTEDLTLTTSQFATPSYSVNASKAYVRQYEAPGENVTRTRFRAENATFRAFDVPFFYVPFGSGEVTSIPLRALQIGSSRGFGFGVQSEWGLFESLGVPRPPGLDASFRADYYADRGPATGFDASYRGGFITETAHQGWNFEGDLTSYLVYDDGEDRLARDRQNILHDNEFRGRIQWQHQHFLPDGWQVQLRAGYVSDETFLEEWFEPQFNDGLPTNLAAYAKRQRDTEALTFLLEYQPSDFVTTADGLQERFSGDTPDTTLDDKPFEIDRLPEIGYYRVGESFNDDSLTLFSENVVGGYRMNQSGADLADHGFRASPSRDRFALPGIPSYGYTGASDDYVLRGDFRQEIDWPIDTGDYKLVPYVVGRYTGYSDSPAGDAEQRLLGAVGLRMTTAFWRIDDDAQSEFLDIHRVRHVIEPELHLFASAASVDREDLYIYDENIDGVSDLAAASFFVRQRWQTKRGGPGRWRSVDFVGFNLGVIAFANTPDEPVNADRLAARQSGNPFEDSYGPVSAEGFRGLFFSTMPEASIPRSSIVGDALWRISDSTILLSDFSWNIDEQQLATAAAGLLVGRGDRLTYYTGVRYIGELDSTIASFNSTYNLTTKYSVNLQLAIDLAKTESRGGTLTVVRRFDRFLIAVGGYYDATEDEGGVQFSIIPEGLGIGVGTQQLSAINPR